MVEIMNGIGAEKNNYRGGAGWFIGRPVVIQYSLQRSPMCDLTMVPIILSVCNSRLVFFLLLFIILTDTLCLYLPIYRNIIQNDKMCHQFL